MYVERGDEAGANILLSDRRLAVHPSLARSQQSDDNGATRLRSETKTIVGAFAHDPEDVARGATE